jgi:hypothetical protein
MGSQIIHEEFRCFEGASSICRIVDLRIFIVLYLAEMLSVSRNLEFNITKYVDAIRWFIYRRNRSFDCTSK